MAINPFFAAILVLASLPALAISLKSASGWRAGVVFAAFYPALVLLVGFICVAAFLLLAPLGLIDLD